MKVTIEHGKYTVVMEKDGRLHALRHGEPWRDCVGDNLIYALAAEVQNLREAMHKINSTVYATGVNVGSDEYFAIRDLCCSNLQDAWARGEIKS